MYALIPHVISVGAMATGVFACGGNSSRVSIAIAQNASASLIVSYTPNPANGGAWASAIGFTATALPYRDFGPLVQYPIYITNLSATPTVVTVTEIVKLPGC